MPESTAYSLLRDAMADAVSQGRLRPEHTDAEAFAQLYWAGSHGIVSLHIVRRDGDWIPWRDPPETALAMIDLLIRGLVRDPHAEREAHRPFEGCPPA